MSYLTRRHPQKINCKCGAPYLVAIVDECAEEGDGWYGSKQHIEFSDCFAPGKSVNVCYSCGGDLIAVFSLPKYRDAVYVDGERII